MSDNLKWVVGNGVLLVVFGLLVLATGNQVWWSVFGIAVAISGACWWWIRPAMQPDRKQNRD